jgi:hypothetical protein
MEVPQGAVDETLKRSLVCVKEDVPMAGWQRKEERKQSQIERIGMWCLAVLVGFGRADSRKKRK